MPVQTIPTLLKGKGVPAEAIVTDLMQVVLGLLFIFNDEAALDHLGQLIVNA